MPTTHSPWLAMLATCLRHVGDMAKCRLFSSRQGKIRNMFSCVSAHFCTNRRYVYVDRYTLSNSHVDPPFTQPPWRTSKCIFTSQDKHNNTQTTALTHKARKKEINIVAAFNSINKAPPACGHLRHQQQSEDVRITSCSKSGSTSSSQPSKACKHKPPQINDSSA